MNGGHGLTETDRNLLFHAARKLYRSTTDKQVIKTSFMDALLTTRREYTRIGSVLGMRFHAEITTELGESKVDYIVRLCYIEPEELDQMVWGQFSPEFYEELTKAGLN